MENKFGRNFGAQGSYHHYTLKMSTRNQVPGLITHTSNIVAPKVYKGDNDLMIVYLKKSVPLFISEFHKSMTSTPKLDNKKFISFKTNKSPSIST